MITGGCIGRRSVHAPLGGEAREAAVRRQPAAFTVDVKVVIAASVVSVALTVLRKFFIRGSALKVSWSKFFVLFFLLLSARVAPRCVCRFGEAEASLVSSLRGKICLCATSWYAARRKVKSTISQRRASGMRGERGSRTTPHSKLLGNKSFFLAKDLFWSAHQMKQRPYS